jgi:hypothetical protein
VLYINITPEQRQAFTLPQPAQHRHGALRANFAPHENQERNSR